jgi:hypothetical protein
MAALGNNRRPAVPYAAAKGLQRFLCLSCALVGTLSLEVSPLAAQGYSAEQNLVTPLAPASNQNAVVGAPLSLLNPSGGDSAVGADALGATGASPGEPDLGAGVTRRGPSGIEITPLGEIPLDAIGVLDQSQGGFGPDLWHGLSVRRATELVAALPGSLNSPTLIDLARRLLLSRSRPPMSLTRVTASPESGSSGLLALRADRLMALGDVEGTWELLQRVPQHKDTPTLARARIDAALLSGHHEEACTVVANADPSLFIQAFWSKAAIYCHILDGQAVRARLGLDLLRERSAADSEKFRRLAFKVLDGLPDELESSGEVDAVDLAMLSHADRLSLLEAPDKLDPKVLHGLIDSESLPLEVRISAAERLLHRGLIEAQRLADLYSSVPFIREEIRDVITDSGSLHGPTGRARLYQAVTGTEMKASRAAVLRLALELAEEQDVYFAMTRVLERELRDVDLARGSVWFAVSAGRALYSLGHFEAASAWMMLGRQEALLNPLAFQAVNGLWPYSRLAGGGRLATDGNLVSWSSARQQFDNELDPIAAERHQRLLEKLFVGLDEADSLVLAEITHPQSLSDAAAAADQREWMSGLEWASISGRLGETILLSITLLGEDGLETVPPDTLQVVVKALRDVGLQVDARVLAIEAAVVNGI